jgi:ABC-type multidrug transport system ATPase subunit
MSELRIRHGEVRRGSRVVLASAEHTATLPAVVALVGINGSGKSSLFMALADNLHRRADTVVTIDGMRSAIAYVPQNSPLPRWLTVEQAARLYGRDWDALVATMPALYLDELRGQRCGALSVGQRQALAVAIALAIRAPVTLLDEPFSALDFRRRIGLLELLQRRHAEGGHSAVVVSSQSSADLVALCTHYIVLRDGRCVFSGAQHQVSPGDTAGGPAAVEKRLLELLI